MVNEWYKKIAGKVPLNVVRIRDVPDSFGQTFEFNAEGVRKCLLAEAVRRLPVAVVSVAGVARTGKSFFLGFLLRYAVIRYLIGSDEKNWLGDDDTKMGGFEFEHSITMKTNGIVMWPTPFVCTTPSGEKICVLLVDTQGTYDIGGGSSTIWATIFAISALMSSLQIYNVEEEITEEDLQSLELDIGFMRLVNGHFANEKPGQRMLFLIRDFKLRDEYGSGFKGGNAYLRERVFSADVDAMHKEVRDHIREGFDNVECCSLPYPGRAVVESKQFSGKVKDIDDKFIRAVKLAVEQILSVDNLAKKTVNGQVLTCEKLFHHMNTLIHEFNSMKIPTVVSPLRALADTDHNTAMEAAVKHYMTKMEAAGATTGFIDEHRLDVIHEDSFDSALSFFHDRPKLGQGEVVTPYYITRLHDILIKKYDELTVQNSSRFARINKELPVWSITMLCLLMILDQLKPGMAGWLKILLVARLYCWVIPFYWRFYSHSE